jgi:DNA-binding NarL/FixJ family response regulator
VSGTVFTVLLVDDHGIVRHGLRALVDANTGTAVIGEADTARALALQPKTVRSHVSNILTKLAVLDRTEAALKARAAGLGD